MGLDAVELLMEVEEHFGITIADDEAAEIRTVGQLNEIVRGRIANRSSGVCYSLPAFLAVRRCVRSVLQSPDLRIRPSSKISGIVPWGRRRELWRGFRDLMRGYAPSLRRPRLLRGVLVAVSVLLLLLGFTTALLDPAILPLGIFGSLFAIFLLHLVTTPFRLVPPENLTTFGDVTNRIVGLTASTGVEVEGVGVEERVRAIIVEHLGVEPDEVVPEADFVKDLGLE